MAFDTLPRLAPTSLSRHLPATPPCALATPGELLPQTPQARSFVCLILVQASSSTRSALPTSPHLAKPSSPSPGVEKSALGCLLDLFFFFPIPVLTCSVARCVYIGTVDTDLFRNLPSLPHLVQVPGWTLKSTWSYIGFK